MARGQLGAAGGGAPRPPPRAPHRASYQVAHSCCQITPLLAAGSAPFPRLFPLWLRQLLFLSSAAPPSRPQYTHPTQTDSIVPKMAALETCPDCTLSSQDRRLAPLGALAWAPCFVLACWMSGPLGADVVLVGLVRLLEASANGALSVSLSLAKCLLHLWSWEQSKAQK